jgi:hypothetical protein
MKNNATVFTTYFIAMAINEFAIVRDSATDNMPESSDNPIRDYILRVMEEEDLRAVDVLANARRMKLDLKQPSFQNVYSGQIRNPGIYTLITISKALGRPFEEMVAAIQGKAAPNPQAFKESEFAILLEMYEHLNTKEKKVADRFVDMVKREMAELLKQQGGSNLLQLRK